MTDPIADMLTRLRNGQMAGKQTVLVPASKMKRAILAVLSDEGYIGGFSDHTESKHPTLEVELKYTGGKPVISEIFRVSTPGLRVYQKSVDIRSHNNGLGVTIVSTSKGVMTDFTARDKKLGGEIICRVF
jgi:small subunit ribosomal protein S8